MPILAKFTRNSDFPAICKLPSVSTSFEAPAKRYEAGEEETITKNITIPPASIVQPAITQYLFTSLSGTMIANNQNFPITVQVDRTSATNMRVRWHIKNTSSVQQYYSGNTYQVDIALFNIP